MDELTFWHLLHAARQLKEQGWAPPIRSAYLTGMRDATCKVSAIDTPTIRLRMEKRTQSESKKIFQGS